MRCLAEEQTPRARVLQVNSPPGTGTGVVIVLRLGHIPGTEQRKEARLDLVSETTTDGKQWAYCSINLFLFFV